MFQGLTENQMAGAIEALLFVTDEPVGTLTLAEMLEAEPVRVERELVAMQERFQQENRGVQLREVAGGWRLFTHPAYHGLIEKYVISWDTRRLSQAALETLAIIAYLQPVTRAGVAGVRGVNSDSSINSLVEKGLVREAGTADAPGSPVLYATTRAFLEKFGLRSPADLPDLASFAPDNQTRELIRERLSVTRAEPVSATEDDAPDTSWLGEDASLRADETAGTGEIPGAGESSCAAQPGAGESSCVAQPGAGESSCVAQPGAEEPSLVEQPGIEEPSRAAQDALASAMASSLGLVDKIDFSSLNFEFDEE